nr:MAG TPA: hypothetical protein [Caudoviricetes sp.]
MDEPSHNINPLVLSTSFEVPGCLLYDSYKSFLLYIF